MSSKPAFTERCAAIAKLSIISSISFIERAIGGFSEFWKGMSLGPTVCQPLD